MHKHGGARIGAGRRATQIDEKRLWALHKLGHSQRSIADRFGVGQGVIQRALKKLKEKNL